MEYKEFIDVYGNRPVSFESYYKYAFFYGSGDLKVHCSGNDSSDIYRSNLKAKMSVSELGNEVPISEAYLDRKLIFKEDS